MPDLNYHAKVMLFGGHIITMDPSAPTAEALAVRGELLIEVGSRARVMTIRMLTCQRTRGVMPPSSEEPACI